MTQSTRPSDYEREGSSGRQSASERLAEQGKTVREDVRELGGLAREAAAEKIGEARERAGGYVRTQQERLGDAEDQFVQRIRERPLQSLLLAAGAGAILGMVLGRR